MSRALGQGKGERGQVGGASKEVQRLQVDRVLVA